MRSMLHSQWRWNGVLTVCGLALSFAAAGPAQAQSSNVRVVSLVLQDFSDCTNSNVSDKDGEQGQVAVVRNSDDTTSVKIAMTVKPDTTYHFFLKCVRQLATSRPTTRASARPCSPFPPIRPARCLLSTCIPKARQPGTSTKACRSIFSNRHRALAASASCPNTENTKGLRSRL